MLFIEQSIYADNDNAIDEYAKKVLDETIAINEIDAEKAQIIYNREIGTSIFSTSLYVRLNFIDFNASDIENEMFAYSSLHTSIGFSNNDFDTSNEFITRSFYVLYLEYGNTPIGYCYYRMDKRTTQRPPCPNTYFDRLAFICNYFLLTSAIHDIDVGANPNLSIRIVFYSAKNGKKYDFAQRIPVSISQHGIYPLLSEDAMSCTLPVYDLFEKFNKVKYEEDNKIQTNDVQILPENFKNDVKTPNGELQLDIYEMSKTQFYSIIRQNCDTEIINPTPPDSTDGILTLYSASSNIGVQFVSASNTDIEVSNNIASNTLSTSTNADILYSIAYSGTDTRIYYFDVKSIDDILRLRLNRADGSTNFLIGTLDVSPIPFANVLFEMSNLDLLEDTQYLIDRTVLSFSTEKNTSFVFIANMSSYPTDSYIIYEFGGTNSGVINANTPTSFPAYTSSVQKHYDRIEFSNIQNVNTIDMSDNAILGILDFSIFTELKGIDVSINPKLKKIFMPKNQDLRGTLLSISQTAIKRIDFSGCTNFFNSNNVQFYAQSNSYTEAEVLLLFDDIYKISRNTYTGRVLDLSFNLIPPLSGTYIAPPIDGSSNSDWQYIYGDVSSATSYLPKSILAFKWGFENVFGYTVSL